MNIIKIIFLLITLQFSAHSTELKILSLNTWMIPGQGKHVKTRLKKIKALVPHYDLLGFQEVFGIHKRKVIASGRMQKWGYASSRKAFPKMNSGLINLSRYEFVKSYFYPFWACKGIQCMSKKGVLYSLVKLDSGKFVNFYNTHLQAYIDDENVRSNQLKTLEFALERNDNGYPNIIIGDFNIIADTDEYKEFRQRFPALFDTWEQIRPSDPGYTWDQLTNYYAGRYSQREDPPSQRLDYILYSHGIRGQVTPLSIEVLDTGSDLLSDHYGLEASLEIN